MKKQSITIAVIVLVGALAGAYIAFGEKPGTPAAAEHDDHAEAGHAEQAPTGPHGGQVLAKDDLSLEIVLKEQGDAPRLEVYLAHQGKPVPPGAMQVSATLLRPGDSAQQVALAPASGGALASTTPIAEPHVFDGTLTVRGAGKTTVLPFDMHEGKIALSDTQISANSIAIQPSAAARIKSSVQLPGEIRLNAERTAHLVARMPGVVESVAASLGERVAKGQVLATLASPAMVDLRSELPRSRQRLELARSSYAREKMLWEEKISAEQDYLQARQALREAEIAAQNDAQKLAAYGAAPASAGNLGRYQIRAPFAGVIVEKQIAAGEAVKDDKALFTVSDLATLWMEVIVPAKDLASVRSGARAEVRASAFDAAASGKVSHVSALIGEQSRTASARIALANPDGVWRPGLLATADIGIAEREVAVAVAAPAIHALDGKTVVFIRVRGGFVPQPVTTGITDGRLVEIVKGLKAGVAYASTGSNVVKAEHGKVDAEHAH